MKKIILLGVIAAFLVALAGVAAAKGWSGYNYDARVFVGTTMQWCMQKFSWNEPTCTTWLNANGYGPYINDKITMKWNAEWDRGVTESWASASAPYDAWENNEWNGKVPEGSGEVWHYKIVWVGPGGSDSSYWHEGGYSIWGQFEVILSQGTTPDGGHIWEALGHAIPTGYGSN